MDPVLVPKNMKTSRFAPEKNLAVWDKSVA
jgi:hypothetical protein